MKHLLHIIVLLIAVLSLYAMAAVGTKLSTYTYNLQKGWNLIGIILEPTDESEQELLAHKLYDYNGAKNVKSYQQSVEVTAGKSYWIYSEADESLVIKGTRIDNPTDEPAPQEGSYALVVGPYDERAAGEEVTVTAPAKEGYSFVSWTVDGISIPDTTQETITFDMPANKVTLGQNYQINSYTLTVDGVPEQVTYGTEVSRTAPDKTYYTFTGWTVEGVTVEDPSAATIEFTMPAGDVTLTTNYQAYNFVLSVDGVEEQVPYETAVEKTAPEKEGYTFTGWKAFGVTLDDPSATVIKFTMPAGNVALTTNYTINSYKLTTDGEEEQVVYGTTVTKTAPEKEGYNFTGWAITDVSVEDTSAATISFTMPANDVTLTATYEEIQGSTYLVVNLANGTHRYTEKAPDLTGEACRTTELWLRKIPIGNFTMGSPEDEVGREPGIPSSGKETQHRVFLSEYFYIGIFEMTQKQFELITGERPSYFCNDDYYAIRPVECVSYDDIRGSSAGAGWPSSHDVDSTSFLGKLRAKTGLVFDLPTEAQWEYACRAGTTTALNTGKNLTYTKQDSAMDKAGRYTYNGGSSSSSSCDTTAGTARVGSYLPNAYGLYDMHGNVGEWCLDWYQQDLGSTTVANPGGAKSGSYRMIRGGGWDTSANYCRSAQRNSNGNPSLGGGGIGFRVVLLP